MEEVVETIVEEAIVIAETAADKIGIGEAAVYAILGYVVVFFGISLLMFVVMAMGKAFIAKDRKAAAAKAAAPTPAAAPAAVSYTHQTLPTTRRVELWLGAG